MSGGGLEGRDRTSEEGMEYPGQQVEEASPGHQRSDAESHPLVVCVHSSSVTSLDRHVLLEKSARAVVTTIVILSSVLDGARTSCGFH